MGGQLATDSPGLVAKHTQACCGAHVALTADWAALGLVVADVACAIAAFALAVLLACGCSETGASTQAPCHYSAREAVGPCRDELANKASASLADGLAHQLGSMCREWSGCPFARKYWTARSTLLVW